MSLAVVAGLAVAIVLAEPASAVGADRQIPAQAQGATPTMSQSEIDLQYRKARLNAKNTADPKAPKKVGGGGGGVTPQVTVGNYPSRAGTFLTTSDKAIGIVPTGHSAMVYGPGSVVESLGSVGDHPTLPGVVQRPNNWTDTHNEVWGSTLKATTVAQDTDAAVWAFGKIGLPYSYDFYYPYWTDRYYCSQLVWADFYRLGFDIQDYTVFDKAILPIELVNSSQVSTFYYFNHV